MDKAVLKPCPFCGGEAVPMTINDEIYSEYVFKYCPNCGAKIKAGDQMACIFGIEAPCDECRMCESVQAGNSEEE